MNSLARYGMSRGRGGTMETLNDIGGSRGGAAGLGGEPILMDYRGNPGNPLYHPVQPQPEAQMQPVESYKRLLDTIGKSARSAAEAEAMLQQFWDHNPSDMNGEIIDRAAKELGVRAPWDKKQQ